MRLSWTKRKIYSYFFTCNYVSLCLCIFVLNRIRFGGIYSLAIDPWQSGFIRSDPASIMFDVDPYHSNPLYTVPVSRVRSTDDGHILLFVKDWILNDYFNICRDCRENSLNKYLWFDQNIRKVFCIWNIMFVFVCIRRRSDRGGGGQQSQLTGWV